MNRWLHVGDILRINAQLFPDKEGAADLYRSLTFKEWNERCNSLANALADRGLKKGDRIAMIAFNALEWLEFYGACAKGGFVAVPIMFRLTPAEYTYILNNSGCSAFIVEKPFVEGVNEAKDELETVGADKYFYMGEGSAPEGYTHLEDLFSQGPPTEPPVKVIDEDTWIIMYTSGTTGRPKGVVRTHESLAGKYWTNIAAMGYQRDDRGLLVMPMCHINSVFYSFVFSCLGATCVVYNSVSFDPEHMIKTLSDFKITFTSLVPTHYIMMLALEESVKKSYNVDCVRKLLISSAPARRDLKLAIMDYFKNSQLYEAYGSTEAGLVTLLLPDEQFDKLGSIGREIPGTDILKLLDEDGNEVPVGEVGELYSRGPALFSEYWKMPEETKDSFVGDFFSAGDMAYKDEQGYYYLVDRKKNMIITGGENVYPSEVEDCIGGHTAVKDVAVIGVPDPKWGEKVSAVVILHDGVEASDELAQEILGFTKGKIAGFKRPKTLDFVTEKEMPRTGTGKILHRVLRERYGHWADSKD
ncbi:class I adenylate-forming enzyme family protein [Dethiosulfatarculus sandiegensis]|uniref:AMP-binding protein n=1 Tax=Dethiosulfatarculus sandiegensis TaxID=1429043 RepID=A0A0D2JX62_9BACT|nr:AMP-binding protein [Dethiosulfatarculus sandiegensis]KIX14175.1 AMP-binding protein [Dethiosulfatarculus sandiegensis]